MSRKELTAFEKISHNLFRSQSEAEIALTADEQKVRERYMLYVTKMLEFPQIPDTSMVNYIREMSGIEKSQAYRDLSNVKIIVGNIKNASKEWNRYMVIEGLKKSYIRAIEKKNLIAEIAALTSIGKFSMLDKEDQDKIPWEELIPAEFEMSEDVSILSEKLAKPNTEERRKALREQYNKATETDFENA
jgi:hypothetical protein